MSKFLLMSAFLLLAGCSTRIADLSIVVPQNTRITQQNLSSTSTQHNITGVDERPMLLLFPLGFPTFENAVNDTLKKGDGNLLINVHVTSTSDWYILYGVNRIVVNADVVKLGNGGYANE